MFEKYDVESELFLASIHVIYPKNQYFHPEAGNIPFRGDAGYGYTAIVCKQNNNYFDLNDMALKIDKTRNPKKTSYIITFIKPLNKYSTLKGRISKRKAFQEARKYYDEFNQGNLSYVQEQQASAKILKKHV